MSIFTDFQALFGKKNDTSFTPVGADFRPLNLDNALYLFFIKKLAIRSMT